MRFALQLRASAPTLLICMALSGNPFAIINPLALVSIAVLAWVARRWPRFRQGIESSWLIGLPICCVLGAARSSSLQEVGGYLAFGVCGSIYGLIWFGLESGTPDPAGKRWTTAVPVLMMLGASFPILRLGSGLGSSWTIYAMIATALVAVVAIWRRHANHMAIWSFAAAVTLCLGVRTFQTSGQPNAVDIALVFLPYATAMFATLAGRTFRLLHHSAHTQPVGKQLRPLG